MTQSLQTIESEIVDGDAIAIGDLYRQAKLSFHETNKLLAAAGGRLMQKKSEMVHGEWTDWVEANEEVLGFGIHTATKLLKAYKIAAGGDYDDKIAQEVNRAIWGHTGSRLDYSGEVEWYTPDEYLNYAREVMGAIDLDPASSATAQRNVKANKFYTAKQNGLKPEWLGRVWLNPPYKQPDISDFAQKMVDEVSIGHVTQAIMLVNNCTDTEWFHLLAKHCNALCFKRGRIKFINDGEEGKAPTNGQAFFYFGNNEAAFQRVFSPIGMVVRPSE